jgi:uncharacterized membrane protein
VSRRPLEQADRVVPTWEDPVARPASTVLGGPWGRHAMIGRALFWTPLRICLALTVAVLALSWLQKAPCKSGVWTASLQYTHLCYSDVIPLYYAEELNHDKVPYAQHPVEYPVLTGWFMYGARTLSGWYDTLAAEGLAPKVNPVESYFDVTALLLALSALVVTWAVYHLSGRRPWDAAMVALSPVLLVHAYTNWDLFAVAFATAGMLAWQRRVPALAGVLLGLGTAAKLYPALFLLPMLLLCLRARRMYEFWQALLAAALAWLAVNVPVYLLYPQPWLRFYSLNRTRVADPDSIWNVLQYIRGVPLDRSIAPGGAPTVLNAAVAASVLAVCVAVAALALRARVRPRLPQLLFLLVAGFLLANKVWSPQYSLWLVPLAVLARPAWRPLLAWQATEAFLWFPRLYWYLGVGNKGLDQHWFLLAVVARDVAVLWLVASVVRDILYPEYDIVRSAGMDDPAGGVLDGAADRAEQAWPYDPSGDYQDGDCQDGHRAEVDRNGDGRDFDGRDGDDVDGDTPGGGDPTAAAAPGSGGAAGSAAPPPPAGAASGEGDHGDGTIASGADRNVT